MVNVKTTLRVLLLTLIMAIVVSGCKIPFLEKGNDSSAVEIYPAMAELPVGETLLLQIRSASASIENMDLKWHSSDDQIAEVSEDGRVTAITEGEAFVEAFPAGDESRKGSCRIVVKEDGPILLFSVDDLGNSEQNSTSGSRSDSGSPNLPGGGSSQRESEPPDTPEDPQGEAGQGETGQGETDEQIPIEQDSGVNTPAEKIPTIGEFIWTIRIKGTIEEDMGESMKAVYKLNLNAKKEGGKNCRGAYKGQATLEAKVDTGDLTKKVLEGAGDVLKKFEINVGFKYEATGFTFDVINYNPYDFSDFGYGSPGNPSNAVDIAPLVPDDGGGITIAPLVPKDGTHSERPPIVSLVPKSGMACGFIKGQASGTFGASTQDINDIGINMDKAIGDSGIMSYRMSITPVGRIEFQVLDIKTNQSFKGQLSRKPMYPD